MIPTLLGPKKRHYIIDHHHLSRALHEEGVESVLVTVVADLHYLDKDALLDGVRPQILGASLRCRGRAPALQGHPEIGRCPGGRSYRSLAGELRRAGGFAKDTTRSASSCGRLPAAEHQGEADRGRLLLRPGAGDGAGEIQGRRLPARLVRTGDPPSARAPRVVAVDPPTVSRDAAGCLPGKTPAPGRGSGGPPAPAPSKRTNSPPHADAAFRRASRSPPCSCPPRAGPGSRQRQIRSPCALGASGRALDARQGAVRARHQGASGPAHIYGFYAKGCFSGVRRLTLDGPNGRYAPVRNRMWGTPTVDFIERLSEGRPGSAGRPPRVGDMAQPGRPMLHGHARTRSARRDSG